MGEVKTSELRIGDNPALSPGEYLRYLREARRGPRMDGRTAAKGRATAEDNAIAEALLDAFADHFRREGALAALREALPWVVRSLDTLTDLTNAIRAREVEPWAK